MPKQSSRESHAPLWERPCASWQCLKMDSAVARMSAYVLSLHDWVYDTQHRSPPSWAHACVSGPRMLPESR